MARLMTIEEVAKELRMPIGTVKNRISRGEPMPPSIRLGRRRLFPATAFDKWITSLVPDPISEPPSAVKSKRGRPRITKRGTRSKSTASNKSTQGASNG